jgi:predicted nucleic acid-binding Zn ribbon protein
MDGPTFDWQICCCWSTSWSAWQVREVPPMDDADTGSALVSHIGHGLPPLTKALDVGLQQQMFPHCCVVCGVPAKGRSRYCGDRCRKRASRLRNQPDHQALVADLMVQLKQRRSLVEHTIYGCSSCEQRFLGERRCPDCNLLLRKLGAGGLCPDCGEPVLVSELLEGALT